MKINKPHFWQSLLVSVSAALFYCVLIPLQTYLGNTDMFAYSFLDVLLATLPAFVLWSICLLAFMLLGELVLGRIPMVIVFAALMVEYFETSVFSLGLPPLNGAIWAFTNPFRRIVDTGLIALVLVICLASYKWLRNFAHWIALGIIVMTLASLFDVKKTKNSTGYALDKDFCTSYDSVQSHRFSTDRNVLVLVLDSFPAIIAERIAKANPDLSREFDGFIAYDNNLAMHEMTLRGLPGLMTGKFLEKDVSANDYIFSALGEDSFVYPYATNDVPVYCSFGMPPGGYTNRKLGNFSNTGVGLVQDGPVLKRNSIETPYISLEDVVRFRFAPYKYKASILSQACGRAARHQIGANCSRESYLYTELLRHSLCTNKTVLSVFHTVGVHGPITRDRFNNLLEEPSHEVEAFYEFGIYNLGQVATFLRGLKEKGIYDKTMIVIAADHGSIEMRQGDGRNGYGAESSILWIKPFSSRGGLVHSRLPTSNAKIADLIRGAKDEDLSNEDIECIIVDHHRKFRAKFGSTFFSFGRSIHFYEWRYDDSGNVISLENLGVFTAN